MIMLHLIGGPLHGNIVDVGELPRYYAVAVQTPWVMAVKEFIDQTFTRMEAQGYLAWFIYFPTGEFRITDEGYHAFFEYKEK